MAANLSINGALTDFYTQFNTRIGEAVLAKPNRVVLNKIKHVKVGGEDYHAVVEGAIVGGVGTTVAQAQALENATAAYTRFQPGANLVELWKTPRMSSQDIKRANGDQRRLLKGAIAAIERTGFNGLGNDLSRQLYGSADGVIGRISDAAPAGASFTITPAANAKFLPVGARISAGATKTGALRDSGDYVTVTNANPVTGLVEVTGDIDTTITGVAQNDYIILTERALNGGTTKKEMDGFQGWSSNSSSTNFQGVDITAAPNPGALGFAATTGAIDDIEQAVLDAAAFSADLAGGMTDIAILNPRDFAKLNGQVSSRSEPKQFSVGKVSVAYRAIDVAGIEVVQDPFCPQGYCYGLELDSLALVHLGDDLVSFDKEDGLIMRAVSDSGAYEARVVAMCQLACIAPIHNWVCTLS